MTGAPRMARGDCNELLCFVRPDISDCCANQACIAYTDECFSFTKEILVVLRQTNQENLVGYITTSRKPDAQVQMAEAQYPPSVWEARPYDTPLWSKSARFGRPYTQFP